MSGFAARSVLRNPGTCAIVMPMTAPRHVIERMQQACATGMSVALAVVVGTEGSTYVQPGAMALFGDDDTQVGWLSGGCLEPEIAVRARAAIAHDRVGWMDIDTRDDEDLLSGSALGCRGRLRIALLPLRALPGWGSLVEAWLRRDGAFCVCVEAGGRVDVQIGRQRRQWMLAADALPWRADAPMAIRVPAPEAVVVFGAGPETAVLLPLLRQLGWMTQVVERRARWMAAAAMADHVLDAVPRAAADSIAGSGIDAALVMHHNFELDREALDALAATDIPYIGLLGPHRRREDLFRVLPAGARARFSGRLHSPVGLPLGGQGPEAIALSIAAQLQSWRAGRAPP